MLRISLREFFLIIVVAAIGAGWCADRLRLTAQLSKASRWRGVAGALEFALTDRGYELEWDMKNSQVVVSRDGTWIGLDLRGRGPNADFP